MWSKLSTIMKPRQEAEWVGHVGGLAAAPAAAEAVGLAGRRVGAASSIMVRMVWLQRQQTEPAPQASATCLVERAPAH